MKMTISRNPAQAALGTYDLIIIGGGIYGVMLSLEASRRGLSSLLLERNDFGGATSFNHLKTIHGGIRYLQSLNLKQYFQSLNERLWFMRSFPDLVKPVPFLMPLYGKGLRRSSFLYAILLLDTVLSHNRNQELPSHAQIPYGKILPPKRVKDVFPMVNSEKLKGGALWYDACIPYSERLLIEVLCRACNKGAQALNYMDVQDIVTAQNKVTAVTARDQITDEVCYFQSELVVNVSGPWTRKNASLFDRDFPELFRASLSWNVLFDREALSTHVLAVSPPKPGGQTYFLHPWRGKILAGTGHAPRDRIESQPHPTSAELSSFIKDLNGAVPGLELSEKSILHVYTGYLPVKSAGTLDLSKKETMIDHSRHNGPVGLFSVTGVKYTTSRIVAEKFIRKTFPHTKAVPPLTGRTLFNSPDNSKVTRGVFAYDWFPDESDTGWKDELIHILRAESVQHLDDLILRRTSLGDNPLRAMKIAPLVCELFRWSKERSEQEILRLKQHYWRIDDGAYNSMATSDV